jgi:hypothetical protein
MFDQMNYDDFCKLINTEFQLADSDENIKLKFFEISENQETSQTVCFSIYLKSHNNNVLGQKIYNLKHEEYGEGELFLVPIRQDEDGIVYESVFNRFINN